LTLSGPEALKSLDDALRDIRREEDEIAKRLARSAELVTKFRETESELFRQLAQVRLDPSTQAELTGRLSQAEIKARSLLEKHGTDLSAVEGGLKALDQQIAKLASERGEQTRLIAEAEAEIKEIANRVSAEAMRDPVYAAKREAAERLAAVAEESLSKTQLAETDKEEKGKPYRDDPLFMYLWERGYGTKNYRENNLIRYLDSLVAKLVGFPEARANFAMLNEIPIRLREHAERQAQLADEAEAEVTALEKAAVDAGGGKPARLKLEAAQARIVAIDAEMVTLEDKRDEQLKQQRELAQGSDPAFSAAVNGLAEALGREDIQQLLAQARATQTGQDDSLVKQIDEVRQRAAEEDAESRDQRNRLRTLAARRRELEDIQYEFKKQGFDTANSRFGDDRLVGGVLNDFLRGSITAADYWGQWQRSQTWVQGRRNETRNRRDPWDQGGGGGFRTGGGGSVGGGFKTGGGF
jgi:chromosome segregation ATPase